MGFTLHTSNKTENLREHLAMVLSNPLPSPFDQEVFLIQSQGMERWLLQGLSDHFGVMANYQLLFPNHFFNEITQALDHTQKLKPDAFLRERLVWTVDQVLRDLVPAHQKEEDSFKEVLSYLAGSQAERKRFQLAQQLTQLFDQYQVYRPYWMEHSKPEHWSLKIWQKVLHKLGDRNHIGRAWQMLIHRLNQEDSSIKERLPKRISVFGIHAMPVVFVQVLQGLAKHTEVHLYVTQPTDGYWADLRRRSEVKLDKVQRIFVNQQVNSIPSESVTEVINHPLLSLLGQQGRDFHQLLIEQASFDWVFDSFEAEANSALTRLQQDIRLNQASSNIQVDDSIHCVSCHSRIREMQVLKDFLLARLAADDGLQLRDIVVMAPKISDYEPFIKTVFHEQNLPTAIADKGARAGNDSVETFMSLLGLLGSRFEWSEVMALLERAPIMAGLKLSDRDLTQLHEWVAQTHTRWGRSAAHKEKLGLPVLNQNTWDAGLKQMMMGFLMQDQSVSIEGLQAQLLAKLDTFVRTILFRYAELTAPLRTLHEWRILLLELIDRLFDPNSDEVRPLLVSLEVLASITLTEALTYDLTTIMAWLEESLTEQKSSQGFMAGQLTFCSMLPMRSIPFKIVCVLGLNEGEFPRQDRRPSFDLMADDFQLGDRSSRIDDRYQFLEIILSARNTLYLSYIGQSQYQPQNIPPSVVLQELLDELAFDEKNFPVKHPLQAFSVQYFRKDAVLKTFHASALKTAQALANKAKETPIWFDSATPLPAMAGKQIELSDLLFFATKPQAWFMQKRLGIKLSKLENEREAHERFEIKGLDRYEIEQIIFKALYSGEARSSIHERVMERGAWLSGEMGAWQLIQTIDAVDEMQQAVTGLNLGAIQEPMFIDIILGDYRIAGSVPQCYENGFLMVGYATLKAKDFIHAWLVHLFTGKRVHLVGLDEKRQIALHCFEGITADLQPWVDLYVRSHQTPFAFWSNAGWAYLTSYNKPNNKKDPTQEERETSAHKAALKAITDLRDNAHNPWMLSDEVIKLTQGYQVEALWSETAQTTTLSLLKPLHDLIKGATS